MPEVGEPAQAVEKLPRGLIIFLVNSCLERFTHLSFSKRSRPALPCLGSIEIHPPSEISLYKVLFCPPNPTCVYHGFSREMGSELAHRPLVRTRDPPGLVLQ